LLASQNDVAKNQLILVRLEAVLLLIYSQWKGMNSVSYISKTCCGILV